MIQMATCVVIPIYDTYRKAILKMKITVALLMLLALALPNTLAQEYTQLNLPEGAVGRLGKGSINVVQYSPDGTQLCGLYFHRYLALRYREPSRDSPDHYASGGGQLA